MLQIALCASRSSGHTWTLTCAFGPEITGPKAWIAVCSVRVIGETRIMSGVTLMVMRLASEVPLEVSGGSGEE